MEPLTDFWKSHYGDLDPLAKANLETAAKFLTFLKGVLYDSPLRRYLTIDSLFWPPSSVELLEDDVEIFESFPFPPKLTDDEIEKMDCFRAHVPAWFPNTQRNDHVLHHNRNKSRCLLGPPMPVTWDRSANRRL